MKKIISGVKPHKLIKDVKWVTVPYYAELKPINVIKVMELKDEKHKLMWRELCRFCPELHYRASKDRSFFLIF